MSGLLYNRGGNNLGGVLLYSALAAGCYAFENRVGAFGIFLWLMKLPAAALAFLTLFSWVLDETLTGMERAARARAITPAWQLAQAIAIMSREQLIVLQESMNTGVVEESATSDGYQNIGGVPVPNRFLERYFESADGFYLPPVRSYAEGSEERRNAQLVTDHLVKMGAAAPAAGNKPARVKTWNEAYQAIGWAV